jgi:hypothetical protein
MTQLQSVRRLEQRRRVRDAPKIAQQLLHAVFERRTSSDVRVSGNGTGRKRTRQYVAEATAKGHAYR